MTERNLYPRPPIVEAVVEFGFQGPVEPDSLLEPLTRTLGAQYPDRQVQSRLDARLKFDETGISAESQSRSTTTFLRSADGLRLIGCTLNTLSVHVLAPYPGWERFIGQVNEAVGSLPGNVKAHELSRLSVRYIDRIKLPVGPIDLSDYLETFPKRPKAMPDQLEALHMVTHALDPSDGTTAVLTLAGIPPSATMENPQIAYDLLLFRSRQPLGRLAGPEWAPVVEALHARQRSIFEQSITDKMRGLFQS